MKTQKLSISSDYRLSDLPNEIKSLVTMIDSMFDEIYLVGGAVRDVIMGREIYDLDFATPESVKEIERILSSNHALKIHDEGKLYGTIAANIGQFDIQVTSYRSEQYFPGSRKPMVSGSTDIDSDLSRRDFTINAMGLSRDELVDPYDGIDDIEHKIIRAVGDADIKFKEDPLRILRAFRFVATFGFNIEEKTLDSAKENSANLQIVASERQGEEIKKLLHGKYWADAINEMSSAGVLNSLLKSFGITYDVSDEDVQHEFEKYSMSQLEAMDYVGRWAYLISIVAYAESAAGITSTDITGLAETILGKAQVAKQLRVEIVESLESNGVQAEAPTIEERAGSVKRRLIELKSSADPRAMIEEANYYTLKGQSALQEAQYTSARKNFQKALEITEKNYQFILSFSNEEIKKSKLRGIAPYYQRRLKFLISAIILEEKLYAKFRKSDQLAASLAREIKHPYVSKNDLKLIIELAIIFVYRRNVHGITLEPYYDFLQKSNLSIEPEAKQRYITNYIESQIRDHSLPPKERARLYHEKAKIAAANKSEDEYGLEYYDPMIDYLFNKMLAQEDLANFETVYVEFEDTIHKYIDITKSQMRPWIGFRKYHLTSASSLIHALTLAKTIEQKLDIVKHIVEDYKNAGRGFIKNVQRYQVYLDWFEFVDKLLHNAYEDKVLMELHDMLKSSSSRTYVDIDEDYLITNRPDIVNKRQLLQESFTLINVILKKRFINDLKFENSTFESIYRLFKDNLLDQVSTYNLLKNYISKDENQNIEIDGVDISDKELRQKEISEVEEFLTGESETIEYKSSWEFNVNRYLATGEKEVDDNLQWEVIKNIAGLANKRGGTLLIGVEDNCTVCGLESTDFNLSSEKDPRRILDKMQRKIRNQIINRLGQQVFAELSVEPLKYQDKTILRIKIPPAAKSSPVIYTDSTGREIYYVRSGTTTDDAGMQALIERANR